jgi:D-beta-D-heptose 7-phosphate kinase/D-beta-D-heptose 1-phosphate adenosyltransferase
MKKVIDRKRAQEIINRFPEAGVLVVGDVMVDHFIRGKVSRVSPEAPVPVVDVQADHLLLGGCANVINNIYAMGGRVYGAGIVGEDEMARRIQEEFRQRRIDPAGLVIEAGRPTTLKTRIIAHGQQVVRFDRESRQFAALESIDKILAYIRTLRGDLGAIVISDYSKGVVTEALMAGILELVSGSNIVVCVDPKRSDLSLYQGVDIITPNHHEAGKAVGFDAPTGGDIVKVGESLLSRYDFKSLLITRGEEGMSLFERDGLKGSEIVHTFFPTEAKEVFDVTGAGDTVIGVFALCMASGATFKEAAAISNSAAGIVVGKVGTATVTRQELKKIL